MKQYGKILQKRLGYVLVVLLTVALLLSVAGCGSAPTEQSAAPTAGISGPTDENVVMTIHGYPITKDVYTIMLYDAAVNFKIEAEPDENLTEEEYEEWFFNFYNIEIDGRMPFDYIRENVIGDLKEYAYYMQAIEQEGLSMSDADKNDIETNILISLGDDYDPENPDDYFIYTYGVTKEAYVNYLANRYLIDTYSNEMAEKAEVSQDKIDTYLEMYHSYYTTWTIQNIFLAAATEAEFAAKQTQGEALLQRIQNGENMGELVAQYSEDGGDGDGLFIVSREMQEYPDSILDWVYASDIGQAGVVSAEDGIYVLKCVTIDVDADAIEEIKIALGGEQIREQITAICQSSDYDPVFNSSVYNAFTKLPGDLMIDDGAVG